ncbi:MAG: outer membrane protein assembly factor BamD [Archangiaceae bacterium]|nr:outer membrane protein assembly factor BamD [Archangiaceae bacterium]
MSVDKLISQLREGTAQAPLGARERVWRKVTARRGAGASRARLVFGGLAAVAAGIAVAMVFSKPQPVSTEGFAMVGSFGSKWKRADNHIALLSGSATVSVWGTPLELEAGKHRVKTDAAVFALRVASDGVELDVAEGEVVLDGERLAAPFRRGSLEADVSRVRALEPADVTDQRAWSQAESRLARNDVTGAANAFNAIGASTSLRAEAAALKAGDLELRLDDPGRARTTFDGLAQRFPHGALKQEARLSALEASVRLGDWQAVRHRAATFLSEFPGNERRSEVQWLALRAAWELGDRSAACADLGQLDGRPPEWAVELKKTCTK